MDWNRTVFTTSAEETSQLGQEMADSIVLQKNSAGATVLCLYGELGSGKTTFIQGFAKGLGITGRLLSPTFVIMRSYEYTPLRFFHHLDLYRVSTEEELRSISFDELITDERNIVAIEWAQRIQQALPQNRIDLHFAAVENGHEIRIEKTLGASDNEKIM